MFAEPDPRPGLNAEFATDAHGLYTTLPGHEREAFVQLLDDHPPTHLVFDHGSLGTKPRPAGRYRP